MKRGHNQRRGISVFILLSTSIISFILFSCAKETNGEKNYIIKDNLIYQTGGSDVFTGKIIDTLKSRKVEYEVVMGKKNGKYTTYYLSGKIEMTGKMKNNKNEGKWKYYYPKGNLESEGYFKNDLPDDKWTWYYANGKIKEEGIFIEGKREGEWIMYDEKGDIRMKIIFRDGEKVNEVKRDKSLFSLL